MEKPTKPCYACGGTDWWQRADGGWCCSRCCPNPGSAPTLQSNEGKYSSEVLTLRDRVILGNKKLNDAWEQIKGMVHDTEEWNYQMERWHQGNEKLSLLCSELQARGYETCLYLDDQGKKVKSCLEQGGIGCRVCPSRFPYWDKEFREL
ncbi:hypothetical protein ES703_62339 [subsurface metagenome]